MVTAPKKRRREKKVGIAGKGTGAAKSQDKRTYGAHRFKALNVSKADIVLKLLGFPPESKVTVNIEKKKAIFKTKERTSIN